MGASRKCHRSSVGKKSPLDHVLDFGPEQDEPQLGAEATLRLREVIRKIEEMSERIDRLTEDDH